MNSSLRTPDAEFNASFIRSLDEYNNDLFGPLLAVSDEGSAAPAILRAAYASAKARAFPSIDPLRLGVILDGERMTSAGEAPIGPPEYSALTAVGLGRLVLTTNVGVRVNARLSKQLPEISVRMPAIKDLETRSSAAGAKLRSLWGSEATGLALPHS